MPDNGLLTIEIPDPPSESDPVLTDPSIRLRICDQISGSGVFEKYGKKPISMSGLKNDVYWETVKLAFGLSAGNLYGASYMLTEFRITHSLPHLRVRSERVVKKEYVFPCVLRDVSSDRILLPFYVSKVYHGPHGIHAHRFLFPERVFPLQKEIMLAEGSAHTYTRPDFNVELHYLALRKHHQPASKEEYDPICQLNATLGNFENDQSFRLCAKVCTSSFFIRRKMSYPRHIHYRSCANNKISFRTEQGIEEAAGRSYNERMLYCVVNVRDLGASRVFYISRAYNPNQVFVYSVRVDESGKRNFYLENLNINVGIVHEPYKLGDVEI